MLSLLTTFREGGHQIHQVGRALREELAGEHRPNSRLDFVTNAPARVIQQVMGACGFEVESNIRGRVVGVVRSASGPDKRVRVSAYRALRGALQQHFRGRELSPLEADLATRDITVNAIARAANGELVDPFGGLDDLKQGRIRTIAPPEISLRTNPLRMLKVARFVSWMGFQPTAGIVRVAHQVGGNVLDLPRELWLSEMEQVLCGPHVDRGLQFLCDTRMLAHMLPEVFTLVGFERTCEVHHKDIWEHTKIVIRRSKPKATVRWAALLHDVGKVFTRTVSQGNVHFFRHEEMSALLFDGIAARFGIPEDQRRRIHYVVENHSRINLYSGNWTDSAVRRLITHAGEHLEDLVLLSRADVTTQNPARMERIKSLLAELESRIGEIQDKDAYVCPLPKRFGEAIIAHFKLRPGPTVGQLRDLVEQAINDGSLAAGLEIPAYLSWLEAAAQPVFDGLGAVADASPTSRLAQKG